MKEFGRVGPVRIFCGDVVEWAREWEGEPFHAVLTDPPYHLTDRTYRTNGASGRGFMGQVWDGGDVAFRPETWGALAGHLLPGAFGVAFGGTRGYHRMACAIEDAGLRLHAMMGWVFGSGFPKSTRIDTQIDKAARPEDIENQEQPPWFYLEETVEALVARGLFEQGYGAEREGKVTGGHMGMGVLDTPNRDARDFNRRYRHVTNGYSEAQGKPIMPLAQTWAGHRYGGQALKPALEPICVWQVPYRGKPVECIVATGAGALWVDGARVPGANPSIERRESARISGKAPTFHGDSQARERMEGEGRLCNQIAPEKYCEEHPGERLGRWPANCLLTHSPGCVRVGTRRVAVGGGHERHNTAGRHSVAMASKHTEHVSYGHADAEGLETVDAWECEPGCPVRVLGEQSGELTSGYKRGGIGRTTPGVMRFGMKQHYECEGDSGTAARFYHQSDWAYEVEERLDGAEPMFYCAKASRGEREAGLLGFLPCLDCGEVHSVTHPSRDPTRAHVNRDVCRRSGHPTVKPVALCRHLATLLLPPAAYAPRRLLIPFGGVASEAIGALLAGWEEIVLVEQSEEYCRIGAARVGHALRGWQPPLLLEW